MGDYGWMVEAVIRIPLGAGVLAALLLIGRQLIDQVR